jgi:hypothetical protein
VWAFMRGALVLAMCILVLCFGAAGANAFVIGPTPQAVALAATTKYAGHEVKAVNQAGVSYTLGTCRVLHRKPWLAYGCAFELHGYPEYCHGVVTVGVRHLPDGTYRGQEINGKYLDDHGC